ncbi:MAG: DNA mismatch repair endonuclease MutL [Anaerolineae bacterium]
MMPIHVLPPDVAAKIAAGEVIERPVSVAKELIENAIDAGANDIRIEILQGGRRLIRVSDNGCGIATQEVELAFARHATSKLTSVDDLYRVATLGFRGEALASIAAVSRLSLSTRAEDEEVGTLLRIEGGMVVSREAIGRPAGTDIQVENLFFNTPARLKFLRADTTESAHVARLAASYGLAYPERRITLQNNGRLVVRTTGTDSLYDALVAVYGLNVAEQMVEITPSDPQAEVQVSGFVSAPALHRANRQDMTFFVNRRWIQDNALAYAVTEAYHALLPGGRHPLVVLNISLPPEEVDVNIHPTKREVRFRQGRELFSAVQKAVRTVLMARHLIPAVVTPPEPTTAWERRQELASLGASPAQSRLSLEVYRSAQESTPAPGAPEAIAARPSVGERLPMLRVLGQVAQTYIIAEGPGGMYLIDQHAAHERIRYEELAAQRGGIEVAAQELLDPVTVEMSPQQATLIEAHLDDLVDYGFDVVPFGGSTFLVRRTPAGLLPQHVPEALGELLDTLLRGGEGTSWEDAMLITLSCHTAVRAGQTLSLEEMRDLVRQLEKASLPHACPHGRPTIIHLSKAALEKEFGRR